MKPNVCIGTLAILFMTGIAGVANVAHGDSCQISGVSTAIENTEEPEMGLWRYTLDVNWAIDSQHALSHMDVILALGECPCICEDFSFAAHDTAGTSTGYVDRTDPCTAYYSAEFNCHGDPSIGLEDEPLVKFEDMSDDCEPALIGGGTFTWFSDWPPAPMDQPDQNLILKVANDLVCYGHLIGDSPLCDCATPTAFETFGRIKTTYR